MEWLASLGIVGLIALCCGGKLLAILLAARPGSSNPANPASGAEAEEGTVAARRGGCPLC
ncbi:hypothetical protein HRbin32_00918 [bacterium HR32]|nr:hypothetical protein HRbin32_00918 [bacterium HR32]